MKDKDTVNLAYSSKSLAKNTIFNLLGYGVPLIVAVVVIPFLIKGLGDEKFGILNLAWIIIGYFGFFDLGIGRAITKIIAEKIVTQKGDEIPPIFWTSFVMVLSVSLLTAVILIIFSPLLVQKVFNISENLQPETLKTFYLLAAAIPIVTTTAGIRGLLEAYQKFGVISVIRSILGISSFLIPLLVLFFTNSMFWIVLFLIAVRIIIWFLYMNQCFKVNNKINSKILFNSGLIKPILKLSGWMTVSNITVPVIVYMDRFLIGALVSAAAITYYATPYEVVTKLLIIPGALSGVLFPAFSANFVLNPELAKKLLFKAVKYLFIFLFPVVVLIISFASEILNLWLGIKFAENSSLILQLLAAGILINSITYIPVSFLEGIGRPDLTAKVQMTELPVYLVSMYLAIKSFGINGAALVWMLRMVVDSFLMFLLSKNQISTGFKFHIKQSVLLIFVLVVFSFVPVIFANFIIKIIVVPISIIVFLFISWKYLLLEDEKSFLLSRLKIF